ncbi:MAG: hypothetical protein EOO85_12240 [Pedobacter sp.]|nr:MAG: hypothetical protein EOO85_12240 [Pedobacter sp.]
MISFAADRSGKQTATNQMTYVINIEDGGGKEFYLVPNGKLIGLASNDSQEPQEFKAIKLALKKMDQLRLKYPPVCRIYVVERNEFNTRRQLLQKT